MITKKEKIELVKKLLFNTKLQLMEYTMTYKFNLKISNERPEKSEEIKKLNIVVEQDISQTEKYIDFINEELKNIYLKGG